MIRFGVALAGALLLSACWADDREGTVLVRPSADAPGGLRLAATVSAPTYTKFADQTGDQSFTSGCVRVAPPNSSTVGFPDTGLAFGYTASTQSWGVTGDGLSLSFGPADIDTSAPAGYPFYAKPGIGSFIDRLRIQTAGIVGIGPLEYARVVSVITNATGSSRTYTCLIGAPTLVTDLPTTPTVTYNAAYGGGATRTILGGATSTLSLGKSGVTLGADLLTGQVTATIHLIGTPASGPDIDLGTVTGTANIDPATGGYYGWTWSSPTLSGITGQFSGRFYGPQGKETEFVLALEATSASTSPAYTLRIASGSVVGIR
ncbi:MULTISPECIES: hypothetical protein [unclassified Sphingomonas]|nr:MULTISPECIES: hypothetical protein [unclassified Sphingomonas]